MTTEATGWFQLMPLWCLLVTLNNSCAKFSTLILFFLQLWTCICQLSVQITLPFLYQMFYFYPSWKRFQGVPKWNFGLTWFNFEKIQHIKLVFLLFIANMHLKKLLIPQFRLTFLRHIALNIFVKALRTYYPIS